VIEATLETVDKKVLRWEKLYLVLDAPKRKLLARTNLSRCVLEDRIYTRPFGFNCEKLVKD